MNGFFAVDTAGTAFSKIGYDQTQEHNNKKVKSTAGYIDLVNKEDTAFLRKLELSLPEIHDYIDGVNTQKKSKTHKECAPAFVTQFKCDCQKLYSKITRNPFNDSIFRKVNSDFIFPSAILEDSRKVFKVGSTQYQEFVKNRFVIGCEDVLKTPIKHNALKLPKNVSVVVAENPRIKISSSSLTKLHDACSFRRSEVKESFKSELTNVSLITAPSQRF